VLYTGFYHHATDKESPTPCVFKYIPSYLQTKSQNRVWGSINGWAPLVCTDLIADYVALLWSMLWSSCLAIIAGLSSRILNQSACLLAKWQVKQIPNLLTDVLYKKCMCRITFILDATIYNTDCKQDSSNHMSIIVSKVPFYLCKARIDIPKKNQTQTYNNICHFMFFVLKESISRVSTTWQFWRNNH